MTLQVTNLNEVNLDGVNANISTWGNSVNTHITTWGTSINTYTSTWNNSVKTHITTWGSSIISKISAAAGGGGMIASTAVCTWPSSTTPTYKGNYSSTLTAPAITGRTCVGVAFAAPASNSYFSPTVSMSTTGTYIAYTQPFMAGTSTVVIFNYCYVSFSKKSVPFGYATFLYV